MSVTRDIIESWRRPRVVVRRHLARGASEPWVFSFLAGFVVLSTVAQAPGLARAAFAQPEVPLVQRLVAVALAGMAMIPVWYLLAAISHLIARAFGGRAGFYGARLALFWALLAVVPAILLQGLVAGFIGPGPQLSVVSAAAGLGFLWLWLSMLHEAER
jgi:hypothetical protein